LATSLQTPTLIRTFQRKLISQAKVVTRRGILARCHIERPTVVCLAVKSIGKPNAGNRHVGFDERGWETGRLPIGSKLPRPSSTLQIRTIVGTRAVPGRGGRRKCRRHRLTGRDRITMVTLLPCRPPTTTTCAVRPVGGSRATRTCVWWLPSRPIRPVSLAFWVKPSWRPRPASKSDERDLRP